MRALIRFLSRGAAGAVETRERVFDGDAITLGRATDQTLHLKDSRVALSHARIFRSGPRVLLACKAPAQAIVNGAVRRDAQLHVDDVVQIGANTLRIIDPPSGFDLAFTFELAASVDAEDAVAEPRRLALAELGLYKRRLSWLMFVTCLAIGLIIPLSGAMREGGSARLRAQHLPSDQLWSPGPLHSAHATLSAKCESCHELPFVQVRSSACLSCHSSNLHQHLGSPKSGPSEKAASVASLQCTACHSEHQEPQRLVQTDQRLCAGCHGDAQALGPEVVRATDFLTDHPDFARPAAAKSGTGLEFSHEIHLDPKGVKAPDGAVVMGCGDCHQPEAGGRRMQPIRMEQHCASCHRLDFDPAEPLRVVPHGAPDSVIVSLTEYYSSRYLAGYPDRFASAKPDRSVRLPGAALSRPERDRMQALARTRAQTTARDLFERRTCSECHEVKREEATWKVAPVQLATVWMEKARFDHSRHGTALTPCATCHRASESKTASDNLMPDIATCRTCHGGEPGHAAKASLIAGTCTMCHDFHATRNPLWAAKSIAGMQEHTHEGQ